MPPSHDRLSSHQRIASRQAHVVSAFEQSLNHMSQRLHNLTQTTVKKDSELHELRATIDALRSQTSLRLSKLWSRPQQTLNVVQSKAGSEKYPSNGSSTSLTGQLGLIDPVNANQSTTQSALESPNKADPTNMKEGETGSKKNGWFRSSIGKAFRKKSSVQSTTSAEDTAASVTTSASSKDTASMSRSHSPDSVRPSNSVLTSLAVNQGTNLQPTAEVSSLIGSRTENSTIKPVINSSNGLSHSNSSSTSCSSCSCGVTGSTNHAPGSGNPGNSLGDSTSGKLNDRKIPSLSCTSGFESRCVDELASTVESVEPGPSYPNRTTIHDSGTSQSLANDNNTGEGLSSTSTWTTTQLQAELARLRTQLNEREIKLTDVQLEALASTHQVNQLRDQIARLYTELQHLRTDNERLHLLVQHEPPETGQKSNIGRRAADRTRQSTVKREAQVNLPGHVSKESLRHCLCGPEIDLLSGLNGTETELRQSGHLALWSLVSVQLTSVPDSPPDGYHIGIVNLVEYHTWESLDRRICDMWIEYVRRLDPTDRLGLAKYRLLALRVNGNRVDQPIARDSNSLTNKSIPGEKSHEGELAGLVRQARIAPESRTVILSQLLADVNPTGFTADHQAEWTLGCLEPLECLTQWIDWIDKYRHAVFYTELGETMDVIVQALAYQLQSMGRVAQVIQHDLEQGSDDVAEWIRLHVASSTPTVIVLNRVTASGIRQFVDLFNRTHIKSGTDRMEVGQHSIGSG